MHSFKLRKMAFRAGVLVAAASTLLADPALAQPESAATVRGLTVTAPAAPTPPASSVPRYTSRQLAQTVLQARLRYYESLGLENRAGRQTMDLNIYGPGGKPAAVRRVTNILTAVQGRTTQLYRRLDVVAGQAYTATVQAEKVFQESLAGKRTAAELQTAERVRELAVQELINTQRETLTDIRHANSSIEVAMLQVDMEATASDYYLSDGLRGPDGFALRGSDGAAALTEGLPGPFGGAPFVVGGRGQTYCRNCRD